VGGCIFGAWRICCVIFISQLLSKCSNITTRLSQSLSNKHKFSVAMGQILQRLRFNWLGEPASDSATKSTFKVVLTLVLCYVFFTIFLEIAEGSTGYQDIPFWIPTLRFVGSILFTIYSIYSLMKLRASVRAKYSIPTEKCGACEDVCCSIWCSCCIVSQMARHTGEYETYKGRLCSETGMAAHTPSVV
jgi:hypothetical protein